MKSIQSKIIFVVVLALIVITALVTAISVTITHKIIHTDADRILDNVSQKEAALINDMLNDFEKSAQIIEHFVVHELDHPDSLMDDVYLTEYTAKIRYLFDEIAQNTKGADSYYICFSPRLTRVTSGFYTAVDADGNLHHLSVDEFSHLTLLTDEEILSYSNFKGTNNSKWVEPHSSRFTGEMVISHLVPLYNSGTFIGILGFNMDFNYLLEHVNSISLYEYGTVLLLDADQDICYNHEDMPQYEDQYTESSAPLINGMRLELRAAYQDIQSGIRPMLTYIILAFLCVFTAALLYTFWVTHKIVTPLKKLTAAAGSMSSGIQDINLTVESKDEIGVLSQVLSDTYAKIREYSTYINALAYRDALTGIKNSTAYTEAIAELNKEINLCNPVFGVIVADINNLKQTNDTFGHEVGNELIVHAARILTDTFKTSTIFRIGGDEFVIILRDKDFDRHRTLIEKMDTAFSSDYITVNDEQVPVSMARGVAIFDPLIDHIYSDVFAKADHAMYLNKMETKSRHAQ